MSDNHWAVFALRDIKAALDCDKYDVASFHIDDAIAAILAQEEQDAQGGHYAGLGEQNGMSVRS